MTSSSVKVSGMEVSGGVARFRNLLQEEHTEKCGRARAESKKVVRGDSRQESETCGRETVKLLFQNNV